MQVVAACKCINKENVNVVEAEVDSCGWQPLPPSKVSARNRKNLSLDQYLVESNHYIFYNDNANSAARYTSDEHLAGAQYGGQYAILRESQWCSHSVCQSMPMYPALE